MKYLGYVFIFVLYTRCLHIENTRVVPDETKQFDVRSKAKIDRNIFLSYSLAAVR